MTLTADALITISDEPLTLDGLLRIAGGARVELLEAARDRIRASRAVVDAALSGPDLVYGLNTGLGHMRNERLPVESLIRYQEAMITVHAGAIGPPLSTQVVRAAMAARVNGFARGGSGATLGAAETLVAMLNAGVHPIVPETGSVGASDLMHMASIALVAIGQGRAEVGGQVVGGGEALQRAGIQPLALQPKDGLALISANGMSVGRGAIVVGRALELAEIADVVFVVALEGIGGNPSIVEPAVAAAKGIAGQTAASEHIRRLLIGSARCEAGGAKSVQDPLSFRVVPQVHGAYRELVAFAHQAVETELNAADDNPLVSVAEGRLISNGNFHPMVLALAFDALRPAIAHVGQLSERRMSHLWNAAFADPSAVALESGWRNTGLGLALFTRYAAGTRYAALRGLAEPASLDVGPLDMGIEDHATNAPESVRRTDEALDALEDILAIELLMAWGLLADTSRDTLGEGARLILAEVDDVFAGLPDDAQSSDLHTAARLALRERLLPAIRGAIPNPT
ncbi:MAG TPA: aromatic amino acid ammonia-lyase [Candidatus Limnocylindrales bacterium]